MCFLLPLFHGAGNTPKSQQNNANGKHQSGASSTSQSQLPAPKRTLYARENVQVGWSSIRGNWSAGSGFHNVGNTCYLNSALQAFFHVPAIAQWLVSDKEHREKGNCQGEFEFFRRF
jgi:ubiquitin carboxyl-terminal hydrolase 36/42